MTTAADVVASQAHTYLGIGPVVDQMAMIRKADINQDGVRTGRTIDFIDEVTEDGVVTRQYGAVSFQEIAGAGCVIHVFDDEPNEDVKAVA